MNKIRKSAKKPKSQRNVCVFKEKPSNEGIVKVLKEHFTMYSEVLVNEEDIFKIAQRIFLKMEEYPYIKFENIQSQKMELSITRYRSEKKLHKKEIFSAKCYPINISSIRCENINFTLTVIYPLRKIKLSYVNS